MTTNKSKEGEPVPYDDQKEMFRNAFNTFLNGTYEEYDLMDDHMVEICVEELERFSETTVVFDSEIDLDILDEEDLEE
jgi:hypothetical protein